MLRWGSHCRRESYITSLDCWTVVEMPPKGAISPGSAWGAHVIVPPVGTFLALLRATRSIAAPAVPVSAPAASAPAPATPAFASRSRRLISRARGEILVGLSDIVPFLLVGELEDLSDPRCLALDVVVERRLAQLDPRELGDPLGVKADTQAGLMGDGDRAALDLDRRGEDVVLL